jgi:hypothetical protein
MREFFETVDEIKAGISFLAKTTEKINVIKERTIRLSGDRSEGGSSMLGEIGFWRFRTKVENRLAISRPFPLACCVSQAFSFHSILLTTLNAIPSSALVSFLRSSASYGG